MKVKSILAVAAFAPLAAFSSVLVYDGFDTDADYAGLAAGGTSIYNGGYPKARNQIVGYGASAKWAKNGTTRLMAYPFGLTLPADLTAAGFTPQEGSCGAASSGTSGNADRGTHIALANDVLKVADGKVYYRALMCVDKTAANYLSKTTADSPASGNYFAAGIGVPATGTQNDIALTARNSLVFAIFRDKAGALHLRVHANDASGSAVSANVLDLETPTAAGYGAENTYVVYAEIVVNAGTDGREIIRAGACPVGAYDKANVQWTDCFEQEIISPTACPTHIVWGGAFAPGGGYLLVDEFCIGTKLADVLVSEAVVPVMLEDTTLTGASGRYKVTGTVADSAATDAGALVFDGDAYVKFSAGAVAQDGAFERDFTLADVTADRTCSVFAYAENPSSAATNGLGTAYSGVPVLAWKEDGDEFGLKPARVTVSRADASELPLEVHYALSSETGAEGRSWVPPSGVVTIPAGSREAEIVVTPLIDRTVTEDITVTVTLAAGRYEATVPAVSADVKIKTLRPPAGCNSWIAPDGSDGRSSTPGNWSEGRVPGETDKIVMHGGFSSVDCLWDSAKVAEFTVDETYTGVVTVCTTYAGAMPTFEVAGNLTVNGGTVRHLSNADLEGGAEQVYRLNVSVGGDFTLGASARIDAQGLGYGPGRCRSGSDIGVHAANALGDVSKIYGDYRAPIDIGGGGTTERGGRSCGGGAIRLAVGGRATIDGRIDAQSSGQGGDLKAGVGAGGSVFVTARSIGGSGTVVASAYEGNGPSYCRAGSGGRIALVATDGVVALPCENLRCNGSIGLNAAGGGTIFVKNAAEANGTLLVGDNKTLSVWDVHHHCPVRGGHVAIPSGEVWTVDRLLVRQWGVLAVPEGATLALPNGFASVSNLTTTAAPDAGLLLLGGTVGVPAAETHVLAGSWLLQAAVPYAFPSGDVRVENGAAIGCFRFFTEGRDPTNAPTCAVSVAGDLTVAGNASIYATGRGLDRDGGTGRGDHGGVTCGSGADEAFDSILRPRLPGNSGPVSMSGGAVRLTVGGTLTLDGNAVAEGIVDVSVNVNASGGGAIDITAARLLGAGKISADGSRKKSNISYSGAAGRIAIRLTDPLADFETFGLSKITASSGAEQGAFAAHGASSGTIYLQTGAQAEGTGVVIVRQNATDWTTNATPLPSAKWGGETDNLRQAALSVEGVAKVVLTRTLRMRGLTMASGTALDLAGRCLTVGEAFVNGTKLPDGTYNSNSTFDVGGGKALADFLSGEGTLVVRRPKGLALILK